MKRTGYSTIAVETLPEAYGPPPSKELVDSVAVYGVIQPLLVANEEDGLRIIDGNRRVMAARRTGQETVPALVLEQIHEGDVEFARLVLQMNNLRSTNDYAEQDAFSSLAHQDGDLADSVAKSAGMSKASISKRARWDVAHTGLVSAFFAHKIAVTVMDAVSKLPADLQEQAWKRYANEGKLTTAAVKEIEDAAKEPPKPLTPVERYERALAAAEEAVGTMLDCSSTNMNAAADMRAWIDTLHDRLNVVLGISVVTEDETAEDIPF